MANEYFTKSVSLDAEVWEALGVNPLSANQLLRVALGLDKEAVPSKRRASRLEREVAMRAASDVTARLVGREDIDHSDTESMPMTHISELGQQQARVGTGSGKVDAYRARGIRPKGDKGR